MVGALGLGLVGLIILILIVVAALYFLFGRERGV
jgi:cbb3-type cytochrome oxidase subunit 3